MSISCNKSRILGSSTVVSASDTWLHSRGVLSNFCQEVKMEVGVIVDGKSTTANGYHLVSIEHCPIISPLEQTQRED